MQSIPIDVWTKGSEWMAAHTCRRLSPLKTSPSTTRSSPRHATLESHPQEGQRVYRGSNPYEGPSPFAPPVKPPDLSAGAAVAHSSPHQPAAGNAKPHPTKQVTQSRNLTLKCIGWHAHNPTVNTVRMEKPLTQTQARTRRSRAQDKSMAQISAWYMTMVKAVQQQQLMMDQFMKRWTSASRLAVHIRPIRSTFRSIGPFLRQPRRWSFFHIRYLECRSAQTPSRPSVPRARYMQLTQSTRNRLTAHPPPPTPQPPPLPPALQDPPLVPLRQPLYMLPRPKEVVRLTRGRSRHRARSTDDPDQPRPLDVSGELLPLPGGDEPDFPHLPNSALPSELVERAAGPPPSHFPAAPYGAYGTGGEQQPDASEDLPRLVGPPSYAASYGPSVAQSIQGDSLPPIASPSVLRHQAPIPAALPPTPRKSLGMAMGMAMGAQPGNPPSSSSQPLQHSAGGSREPAGSQPPRPYSTKRSSLGLPPAGSVGSSSPLPHYMSPTHNFPTHHPRRRSPGTPVVPAAITIRGRVSPVPLPLPAADLPPDGQADEASAKLRGGVRNRGAGGEAYMILPLTGSLTMVDYYPTGRPLPVEFHRIGDHPALTLCLTNGLGDPVAVAGIQLRIRVLAGDPSG
ncbi:hypothetical protein PAPYR_5727 [Paratrimastix pyriformis]|uniref:Uncharacterized protein n=1 Tax=Paratrimastix pyriformis TaxID=342808 RepID=A0ABQ8UGZ7_9EUKA|nr:hypothetical protein PAPYR_5727 [Paratrimastix pyriformis]